MARRGDFYEDDEPIEKLITAFDSGLRVETAPLGEDHGRTLFVAADEPDHARELSSVGGERVTVGS